MSDESLRTLLAKLRAAEEDRLRAPRDTAAFEEATRRVDTLTRAVWREAAAPPSVGADARHPDPVMDL